MQEKELNLEELEKVNGGTWEYRGYPVYTLDEAYDLADGTDVKVYQAISMVYKGIYKIHSRSGGGSYKIIFAGENGEYAYGDRMPYIFGPVDQ